MKFYDRVEELSALNEELNACKRAGRASLIVVFGRRRVGKTRLVFEWIKRGRIKQFAYVFVGRSSRASLLRELSEAASRFTGYEASLNSVYAFLKSLTSSGVEVVFFDEFQNFRYSMPEAVSDVQRFLDEFSGAAGTSRYPLMMVVAGSSIGLVRKLFIDSREPLFGRASRIIRLKPLKLKEVWPLIRDIGIENPVEIVKTYAVFGGIPYHYAVLEGRDIKTAEEAIDHTLLRVGAPLLYEPQATLAPELGAAWPTYFTILSSIAHGAHRLTEIASRMGWSPESLKKYLLILERELEVVTRLRPVALDKYAKRRTLYVITDEFLRFWFRAIHGRIPMIEAGQVQTVKEDILKAVEEATHIKFEEIVREFLLEEAHKLGLPKPVAIGKWWSGNNEIDVSAVTADGEAIIGEVKWSKKPLGVKDVKKILRKLAATPLGKAKYRVIASKEGFKKDAAELCTKERTICISLSNILETWGIN